MQLHRWPLLTALAALAALACNVEAGEGDLGELELAPAPRPVDVVWVTGEGAAPDPATVDGLTGLLEGDGVDLRVVVLGGVRPFEGPEFAHALREDAAVHVVLAGQVLDDGAALDERIAWAVGGPYVLHVLDDAQPADFYDVAAQTGGLVGLDPGDHALDALARGIAEAAPLPCSFEVPTEVLDLSVHPGDWRVSRASGSVREPVANVVDPTGCVGAGGWYLGEAGAVQLCPSSCAVGAAEPEARFVVGVALPR